MNFSSFEWRLTGLVISLFIRGVRGCKCGSFSDSGCSVCHLSDFCGVLGSVITPSSSRLLLQYRVGCSLGDGLLSRFLCACRQGCSLILLDDISDSLVLIGGALLLLLLHFILILHDLVPGSASASHRA